MSDDNDMADTSELEAKIAALAGRINLHKQQAQDQNLGQNQASPQTPPGRGRGRGRGGTHWAPARGTPYGYPRGGYPRGRAARFAYPAHRNRTLVLNGNKNPSPPEEGAQPTDAAESNTWVSKNDRHMQLINSSVYDQISQERNLSMVQTLQQKQAERDDREKAKLGKHFNATLQSSSGANWVPTKVHEIQVNNIPFQVADGGSKLLRLSRDPTQPTPKRTKIAGVMFLRSKNGNLYRAGLIKTKRRREVTKIDELCPCFTTTGSCSKGPNCRFVHDFDKLAICKDFLLKGDCALGDGCDLSHTPDPHRVPACLHFLRGNCTNDNCRYAHVRVNPSAPVCRAFARLGYCSKGPDCPDRHMFECPDYANKGLCRNTKCRLPHVDHAGQLRNRRASTENLSPSDEDYQDISSDEEIYGDSDDVDSEGLEDDTDLLGLGLSQQQDFVRI